MEKSDFIEDTDALLKLLQRRHLEQYLLVRAAREMGISFRGGRSLNLFLQYNGISHHYRRARGTGNSRLAVKVSSSKILMSNLLRTSGVNSPEGCVFRKGDLERAWAWARDILPVVLKPMNGIAGRDVHVELADRDAFEAAFNAVAARNRYILCEKFVPGETYRFTVINNTFAAAYKREYAQVIGDGQSTIAQLIDAGNVRRRQNPRYRKVILKQDDPRIATTLARQGHALDTILPDGAVARLTTVMNRSAGATLVDASDEISASDKAWIENAASKVPGLMVAGWDVVRAPDGGLHILEANDNPAFASHYYIWRGKRRDLAPLMLKALFGIEDGAPDAGRPVVPTAIPVSPPAPARTAEERPVYQGTMSAAHLENHAAFCTGPGYNKSLLMESELAFRGLKYERLGTRMLVAETPRGQLAFRGLNGPASSNAGEVLCDNKVMTRRLLDQAGLKVALSQRFGAREPDAALGFADSVGWPVVIKPVSSARGRGVFADLADADSLKAAWSRLRKLYRPSAQPAILVEKHFTGDDYRIFVVGDQVVSVTKRARASVTGDGTASIRELIDRKNALRRDNPYLRTYPIPTDAALLDRLAQDGGSLSDVPAAGAVVVLRNASNLSAGGDSIDCTDTAHIDYLDIAIRARQAIPGMAYLGVDIMTKDITRPADGAEAYIVGEVEFSPAILSVFPLQGTPRNMAGAVLDYYLGRAGS